MSVEFDKGSIEPTLYMEINEKNQVLIVFLYVDDLIFTHNLHIDMFKKKMMKEFGTNDLGMMKFFLGIKVSQYDKGIFICQIKYFKDTLRKFSMMNSKEAMIQVATGTNLIN